jgi:solute carrier family 13 (sodium-dependent dicarboxylate transporter), member 2/3/5
MDKIQLIFFFISGFLVSRLIIKVRLPNRIVYWFIGEKHLSISKILFYIIIIAAFLSIFIPNVITVLTLLPLLELLRRSWEISNGPSKRIATMLALALIYGANIGGMGSITATPANGILVTYALLNNVPGIEDLSFASWLVWGIPLVIVFSGLAWLICCFILRSWQYQKNRIHLPFETSQVFHPLQKKTLWITVFYFSSSFVLSFLLMRSPDQTPLILIITGILTLVFILFLFLVPVKSSKISASKQVLLKIADCYNDLPAKGFVFVGVAVALAGILYVLNIQEVFAKWAGLVIPKGISALGLFLFIALATSFSTEILSNTAVQLSFFVMVLPLAETMGFPTLDALIIITLSCTCAFMSPIATLVNGLAFGGVKGVSVMSMLVVGFFMNITGALLISSWTLFFIGRFYGHG